MSADFKWRQDRRNTRLMRCQSDARSWGELHPAFVSTWTTFAELLGTKVPLDVRNEINLTFFASSGRVTMGHGRRSAPMDASQWESLPHDYVWTVMCTCRWVEEQWYAISEQKNAAHQLGELGVTFARHCLLAASDPQVVASFLSQRLGRVVIYGQGSTQSPSHFEAELEDLLNGRLPDVKP